MSSSVNINKLAMIGCGSMGGGMTLLFAEHGIHVSLQDPSEDAMDNVIKTAKDAGVEKYVSRFNDYESLCKSLGTPKVLVFSLPHGSVGDTVLSGLLPYLDKNDIIIDGANEHWTNTERRQGTCYTKGIRYIGMGVSGGYQSAREGPSMCPGGDDESLDIVLPLLRKVAAKDKKGNPCVGKVGTGGSGHYVKMVHNGIEHGMMSAISEAWQMMNVGLGMDYDDIGNVLDSWNKDGPLRGTFLIDIGAQICRTKDESGTKVLGTVQDKVVQDVTGEEGTGIWSNDEAVMHHVPAPTLVVAHDIRLASSDRNLRIRSNETMQADFPPKKLRGETDKSTFIKALEQAVYIACLVSFVQGINVIDQANQDNKWNIDYKAVLQIWRAGCIIQADHIAELLEPIFDRYKDMDSMNLFFERSIAKEIKDGMPSLRRVVLSATEGDHIVPALSGSLEYVKYQTNTDLPTQFYEAELDFFGAHMYDIKGEKGTGAPSEGKHHFEWKPAKSSKS
ncbi:6-phosphogluconate dehydrogenase C-terminal domain-like protein [Patellaria atrata CBS 101060]|uniref:6-phosphogluconate dehydrogenase, decarboxylating n=1 Tax=Patellaria atrata CBS 101060 TaxID=1346257 RepID=A0A9P4VUR6_9PEZI|nr:6-phosphogluconate dehydrogenase C-terminal domain-like protein [Patellaria atrata CBS 101060]